MPIVREESDGWKILEQSSNDRPIVMALYERACFFRQHDGSGLSITLMYGSGISDHSEAGAIYYKTDKEGVRIATNMRCIVNNRPPTDNQDFLLEKGMSAEILQFLRDEDPFTPRNPVRRIHTLKHFEAVQESLRSLSEKADQLAEAANFPGRSIAGPRRTASATMPSGTA